MKNKRIKTIFIAIEILFAVVYLSIVLFILVNSFKTKIDFYLNPWGIPNEITLENYFGFLINYQGINYWLNSLNISTLAILISLPLSIFFAFTISIDQNKKRVKCILFLISCLYFFPDVILLTPLHTLLSFVGFTKNLSALIFMYVKALVPSMIMFLFVSFRKVSSDIIDSYLIDGTGWFRLIYCEYIKLCKFEILFIIMYSYIVLFKDYTIAYIFNNEEKFTTITVAIAKYLSINNLNYPQYYAATIITEIPFFLLLFFVISSVSKNQRNI